MEGVGHFLMLEKPAEFNATLTAKLRKFDLIGK
jgi:pimeloyl-ACP methyl ester carboxylesterase